MTYSVTARREKARFLCSDLDIEGAEFWKRKLERDGWTAIVIRDCTKPHNVAQTRFPWFLATCGFVAIALISYLIYIASLAFPIVGEWFQLIGGVLLTFGLVVVTARFAEGFMK